MPRKLFLSIFLAFILPVFSLFSASPEEHFTFDSGTGTITGYTGPGGDVEIPSTIGGVNVTSIGNSSFFSVSSLTSITIPMGITSIGHMAFDICTSLTSVSIPAGVLSIGNFAFYLAPIDSITIPASTTSIGVGAFAHCALLTEIVVDPDNQSFSSLNGVLFNKGKTELLQCPGGKNGSYTVPAEVVSIGDKAFEGCALLNSIILPDAITSIGSSTFFGCANLASTTESGISPDRTF